MLSCLSVCLSLCLCQSGVTAADVVLLVDWMIVNGQAARVLPTRRAANPASAEQSLIAVGEPPAVSPLSHDRAVIRLAIQQMQLRSDTLNRQAKRSLHCTYRTRHTAQLIDATYLVSLLTARSSMCRTVLHCIVLHSGVLWCYVRLRQEASELLRCKKREEAKLALVNKHSQRNSTTIQLRAHAQTTAALFIAVRSVRSPPCTPLIHSLTRLTVLLCDCLVWRL